MMEEEKTKLKEFAGKLLAIWGISSKVNLKEILKILRNGDVGKMVEEKIDKLPDEKVREVTELIKKFNEN